jgi:hypothetical protein
LPRFGLLPLRGIFLRESPDSNKFGKYQEHKNRLKEDENMSQDSIAKPDRNKLSYFQKQELNSCDEEIAPEWMRTNLYEEALRQEKTRIFESSSDVTESALSQISEEIKVRVKITQHEIFKIGELLYQANKLCKQSDKNYKEWIEENWYFSYETAKNFENVYKNCLGFRNIAVNMKPSVLYKVASPSFNEELRDYLFEQGNIENLSNGNLKRIKEKFNEGGFEAIQDEVEQMSSDTLAIRQASYTIDIVNDCLKKIEEYKVKIEHRGKSISPFMSYEKSFNRDEEDARNINKKLHNAIENANEILNKAHQEAEEILQNTYSRIRGRFSTKDRYSSDEE